MGDIVLRNVTAADYEGVLSAERRSTPNLQYLPQVFDQFLADPRGEFTVATIDDAIVACAKFTVLPDNSAWLETIRVAPQFQGLGIGKRFYENYETIAQREGVSAMRMYTGIGNAVSKGLAERYGLKLAETFTEMIRPVDGQPVTAPPFEPVTDAAQATDLIMPHATAWGGFLVMNRTFYRLTAALCADLAQRGMVYAANGSVLVAGARFMPDQALHVGFFSGDGTACLAYAVHLAQQRGIPKLNCIFPARIAATPPALLTQGFVANQSQLIVMEHTC